MMNTEYATCLTNGCGNQEEPIPVLRTDESVIVICGVCGTQVTNITDIKPTEGTVLPEWISQMLQTQNSGN